MKWITRERVKVDRVACPWLISRFIDANPEFLFAPGDRVAAEAERTGATPYDVAGVELGHDGPRCSFDAFLKKYGLAGQDEALDRLALIVRGADTADRDIAPESRGLLAVANGFHKMGIPDHESLALQFPVYDALYLACGGALPVRRPLALVS